MQLFLKEIIFLLLSICLLSSIFFSFIVSFIWVLRWLSHVSTLQSPSLYEGSSQLSALPVSPDCLQLVY